MLIGGYGLDKREKITVIVPCYNEQEVLHIFHDTITGYADAMTEKYSLDWEFLFIDDGSSDDTFKILCELAEKDSRVCYVSFSRNFGKESAMYAGLDNSTGDYVVFMDADLQDPPALLEEMYLAVKNDGYDCVATRRKDRKGEPPIRSLFARMFYKIINKMTKTEIVDGARDFRLMTRQMANAILSMKEVGRFSKGIFSWVGFKTKWLSYDNIERAAGKTKWSFWKLFLYSIDGIVSFSTKPLSVAALIGLFMCAFSFVMTVVIVIRKLIFGDEVVGWASTACIICFSTGLQLFCTGIIGLYISKLFDEIKNRPIYIVKRQKLSDEKSEVNAGGIYERQTR